MNVTPEIANGWVIVAALTVSIFLGTLSVSSPLMKYIMLNTLKISGYFVFFMGIILLTSPKWTEVAIKIGDFEGKISTLKAEIETSNKKVAELSIENQVLTDLNFTLEFPQNNIQTATVSGGDAQQIDNPTSKQPEFAWPVNLAKISNVTDVADGVNIEVPIGTPVASTVNGYVAFTGSTLDTYGNMILIRHANSWVSVYGYLLKIDVAVGDLVQKGDLIAYSGAKIENNTSTIHFELRHQGRIANALKLLPSR